MQESFSSVSADSTREFIIDMTGGDDTVNQYDQCTALSDQTGYDHLSANQFLITNLENQDPHATVMMIMNGFRAHFFAFLQEVGITINPSISTGQLCQWTQAILNALESEQDQEYLDLLNSDLNDLDKIGHLYQLAGPGTSAEYLTELLMVSGHCIDQLKAYYEAKMSSDVNEINAQRQQMVKEKMDYYQKLKGVTSGTLFSDRYALSASTIGLDIDTYTTAMMASQEYYVDNLEDFFLDLWGCLILSATEKDKYEASVQAAINEFFEAPEIKAKALAQWETIRANLP